MASRSLGEGETNGLNGDHPTEDPFLTTPSQTKKPHNHRFSSFDTDLFALNQASSSPSQAKRALEAHLAETERRLHEASKLGTALVKQRQDLSDRLREVERQQEDGEIGPELRQKLIDIEKEYVEVGRESARAGLGPKSRVASSEEGTNSLLSGDGRTPASPATFSAQASHSPSKFHVPSRKQRNLPSGNVQNIEFITEISTSLLSNVRQLQMDLAEKEEVLKTVNLEKSQLEVEVEGLMQRLRSLDESEQRYKDENWSLETQIHDLLAAAKEASDREQRLTQSLNSATAENSTAHRELDELRQAIERQVEDHAATRKNYDSELSTLRRNLSMGDSDRGALQRKVEELTSQNQELAKAMAARLRDEDVEVPGDVELDNEDVRAVQTTPEHSPPPSPVKGTPRHSNLESETIKSSLHHAHRMIQNLKSNIHREKSEKVELKRMLQEARDELELRRGEGNGVIGANKRQKAKSQHDIFKKPARPSRLGGERNSRTDVLVDETGWEDHNSADSPDQAVTPGVARLLRGARDGRGTDRSDAYQTANETDDVFDTANERDTATETEAFQTGAESLDGDSSDELTETEGDLSRGRTIRQKRPSTLADSMPGDFNSFTSTASESTDEDNAVKTPVQVQPQRYRLKINRGAASRRSRLGSEPLSVSNTSSTNGSPASFIGSTGGAGQTLFAELGDLNGGESTEESAGTPSKVLDQPWPSSGHATPAMTTTEANLVPVPMVSMVDSAMMTEPWEPTPAIPSITPALALEERAGGSIVGTPRLADSSGVGERSLLDEFPATPTTPPRRDMGTQRTPSRSESLVSEETSIAAREPGSARENPVGIPGASTPYTPIKSIEPDLSTAGPEPPKLSLSGLFSQHIKPRVDSILRQQSVDQPPVLLSPAPLSFSFIQSLDTRPIEPNPPIQSTVQQMMPAPSTVYRLDRHFNDLQPSLAGSRTSKAKNLGRLRIAEDDTSQEDGFPAYSTQETALPFRDISANVAQRELSEKEKPPAFSKSLFTSNADQGSQTLLSYEQIEAILRTKERNDIASRDPQQTSNASLVRNSSGSQMIPPALRTKSPESPSGSISKARGKMTEAGYFHDDPTATRYPKRPSSSGSIRPDSRSHPPLPPDHREAIAAATQKAPSSSEGPPSLMGPPLAPASAYKVHRPRTPSEPQTQQSTVSRNGNPQKPRFSTSRSQLSHRSSFSSFASELDERFNIRGDGVQLPYNYQGGGTDPRMIQAITQTMIGEYLWKYTRKPGRGELSDSRHRRYVWVHPYTRTLFWSERGPSVPGKAEGSSKNLPIEAVRVVTDDNPMPPGLHRKSLEIITPERIIKLTATTGQRHETWFNAISYLLLRTGAEASGFNGPIEYDYNQADASDDLTDFNPPSGRDRRTGNTRVSMSSYNSRAVNNASPQRNVSSASKHRQHPAVSVQSSTTSRVQKHQPSHGSISRLSHIFKPSTVRGSFSSRISRQSHQEADPDADALAAHDSAEDLRQVIAKQEKEADRLENVRACCDGLLDEEDTPPWATQYDPSVVHQQKTFGVPCTSATIAAEQELPPTQAQAARNARLADERAALYEGTMGDMAERRARVVKRFLETLNSPRVDSCSVAKMGLKRIIQDEGLDEFYKVQQAVESVLYRMVVEPSIAECFAKVLDRWIDWTERDVMNKEHMDFLKENRHFMLCFMHDAVDSTGLFEQRCRCVGRYPRIHAAIKEGEVG